MKPQTLLIVVLLVAVLFLVDYLFGTYDPNGREPSTLRPELQTPVMQPNSPKPATPYNPSLVSTSARPIKLTPIYTPNKNQDGGLKGEVIFSGTPPAMPRISVPTQDVPSGAVPNEKLIVNPANDGIQWAVIRIMNVPAPTPLPASFPAPVLSTAGLIYLPHVFVLSPTTNFTISNPSGVIQNFHSLPVMNPESNIAIVNVSTVFNGASQTASEVVPCKNDVHSWMKCYMVVHDPRYCAVTGPAGAFNIPNVPPGSYQVLLFQEWCGERTFKVTIWPGQDCDVGAIMINKMQ